MTIGNWINLATLVVSIILGVVYLEKRFTRLEYGQSSLKELSSGSLTLIGTLIKILHKRHVLDDTEFGELLQAYTNMAIRSVPNVLKQTNPLTNQEIERLREYIRKAQQGHFFTPEEVREYNSLVLKLEREKPKDPGIWPLVALGAFLLGLFFGGEKE